MRRTISAILMAATCLVVQAEVTGRISGKVLNKAGNPIVGAKVNLRRLDNNWTKDLFADKHGNYFQVGLDPKDYVITASAEGYVGFTKQIHIPIGDVLNENITLLTPEEAKSEAIASGKVAAPPPEDPGAQQDMDCRENFNQAIPLYNEGKFAEALPFMEKARKAGLDALATLKDEKMKTELAPEMPKIERVLGICMAHAGEKKENAEPFLLKALETNPKDERVIEALVETSKAKADKVAEQKYTSMLEALHGPNPDLIYNKGVQAFNAGHNAEAKELLLKAIAADAKFAKAHYLLGMIEYANTNLKGTKLHFLKYLELAPTGDKAAEIKEMLNDPSLKHIK